MPKVSLPSAPESCKVFTPFPLAKAMATRLGDNTQFSWLEPCVGYGVFLSALKSQGVGKKRITAIDLDLEPNPADSLAKTIRGADFLSWSKTTSHRFDRIIGNPPYVAICKLPKMLRDSAIKISDLEGNNVSAKSNYWHAFFCASLGLLREGGGLCFVLPASWDYADYAAEIRGSFLNQFLRVEIHRSKKPIFNPVQDGCIVVLADGYGNVNQTFKRFEYNSGSELIRSLGQSKDSGNFSYMPERKFSPRNYETVALREILRIQLGGVTGDASYFLLTEDERIQKRLPLESVKPVLTKSKHLMESTVSKRIWDKLREADERVWLFSPSSDLVKKRAVKRYLELKPQDGGCNRNGYKITSRDPWYQTPLPQKVEGFISGMSHSGPWMCFNKMAGLYASNTLYTFAFSEKLTLEQKAAWGLSFISNYTYQQSISKRRIYASGLIKYEPGDLHSLSIVIPQKIEGAAKQYSLAIQFLLNGHALKARKIADEFLGLRR